MRLQWKVVLDVYSYIYNVTLPPFPTRVTCDRILRCCGGTSVQLGHFRFARGDIANFTEAPGYTIRDDVICEH
jgi:hypothetical protein